MTQIYGQQVEALNQNNGTASVLGQTVEIAQTQNNPMANVMGVGLELTQTMTNPACHIVGQTLEFTQTHTNPACAIVGQNLEIIEAIPLVPVRTCGVYMEVLRTPDDVVRRNSPIIVTAS